MVLQNCIQSTGFAILNHGMVYYVLAKLKNFVPHLREVEDWEEETTVKDINLKESIYLSADDLGSVLAKESNEKGVKLLEYRDEADRKWWKFFDEYEYRFNKYKRSKHKWYSWFEEGTTAAEKKLLIKLDIMVAFYLFVVYWIKALDQNNIANAYVSGLQEEINMKGNDYINVVTVYNVAAVVFQFPFMYLFPKFSLHYILPLLDLGWGFFTLGAYAVQNNNQLLTLRFFVGAFESAFYPAAHYLMGSWYLPNELGRRGAIYYFGQMIGTITSGLMQASIHRSLNGINGLSGWRWMFIMDAVITLPVGILGFYFVPGTPNKCYSLFLTDDEIRLARRRLKKANIKSPSDKSQSRFMDKNLWKRILKDWKVYILTLFSTGCWNNTNTGGAGYILWLKSTGKWSTSQVNDLSTITPGIGVALIALCCGGADLFNSRFGAICLSQLLNFIGNCILTIWNVPYAAKWFAFGVQYSGWAQASVMYAWCNDILRHDAQERAIVFLLLYSISQSTSIWITRLVWPTVEAPRFKKGYATTMAFAIFLFIWSFVVLYFYKKDERKNAEKNGIILYNSKAGDLPPEFERHLENTEISSTDEVKLKSELVIEENDEKKC
ncbi:uncharacterized protein PRCAT00002488001 [Priceomyces carsonii]|uniref:uncharacterized protein n=1 Tax=Priceomyces carsonii TaxID=28549 RepID=UPI002ED7AF01|nr:unnamed protein product [Priceomyces carsonii]